MVKKQTELTEVKNHTHPIQTEAERLIAMAIDKGTPVESLEKLLAMRRELKAEQAKEAYDKAMANFQKYCPVIEKTKQGYNYKYADFNAIIEQIKGLLADNGFSYTFDTDEDNGKIIVYCKINHIAGHERVSKATIARETQTKMNSSQQSGAQMTYGKRYALVNALGIVTGDEDTDASDRPLTAHQMAQKAQYKDEEGLVHEPIENGTEQTTAPQAVSKITIYITVKQKGMIQGQLKMLGKDMEWLTKGIKAKYNVEDYHNLNIAQASEVIAGLDRMLVESKSKQSEEDQLANEVDAGLKALGK